jgi:hypothetical protein
LQLDEGRGQEADGRRQMAGGRWQKGRKGRKSLVMGQKSSLKRISTRKVFITTPQDFIV